MYKLKISASCCLGGVWLKAAVCRLYSVALLGADMLCALHSQTPFDEVGLCVHSQYLGIEIFKDGMVL